MVAVLAASAQEQGNLCCRSYGSLLGALLLHRCFLASGLQRGDIFVHLKRPRRPWLQPAFLIPVPAHASPYFRCQLPFQPCNQATHGRAGSALLFPGSPYPAEAHSPAAARGSPGESPAVLSVHGSALLPRFQKRGLGGGSVLEQQEALGQRRLLSVRAHGLFQAPLPCLQSRSQLAAAALCRPAAALGGSMWFIPHEGLSPHPQ